MTRPLFPSRLPRLLRPRQNYGRVGKAGFHTTVWRSAAHEFSMPAMSPTMTEGNITSWKVQEGDTFAAGDVLLEIETDKAQMDVEAQDDGVMAKIVQPSGSKAVKVGTRIAVTADPDDDLATLDLSALSSAQPALSSKESVTNNKSEQSGESPPASKSEGDAAVEKTRPAEHTASHIPHNQKYPLFPSVIQMLHERGISEEESNKISASGPNGRLLKGDVLAYLGEINPSYPADQSKRIESLGLLDLSNVELAAAPKRSEVTAPIDPAKEDETPTMSEVALPISLAAVQAVRERIQRVLGVDISIETFIARATHFCNDDLPRPNSKPLSADELFNAVLGLDRISDKSAGSVLVPQLQAFASTTSSKPPSTQVPDIYDELTGTQGKVARSRTSQSRTDIDPSIGMFSVAVPAGDEKRARVFLERLKTVLQVEPGKLVL